MLTWAFLILFICSILTLILPSKMRNFILSVGFPVYLSGCLITAGKVLLAGETLELYFHFNSWFGEASLVLDPLAAFFTLLISIMGTLGFFYARGYLKAYTDKKGELRVFGFVYPFFILSMNMVVLVQHAFYFLFVWELMSLSSLILVIFEHEKKEVMAAGLEYFIWMHVSFLFLLAGFIIGGNLSGGSYSFQEIGQGVLFRHQGDLVFLLLFLGFSIKAGFFPFHSWLIKAHPAAPANISGIMSGVMLKIGIYGILRSLDVFQIKSMGMAFFIISIAGVTALYGIIFAIVQKDIKRILAYSSVENIGIIGLGIGTAILGKALNQPLVTYLAYCGTFLHIMNHALYKSLLFYCSGNVYQLCHEKNIDRLGGLVKYLPKTGILALIACLGITALPPLNGFLSEFILFLASFNGLNSQNPEYSTMYVVLILILSLVGVMSLVAFTRFFGIAFLGTPRSPYPEKKEERTDGKIVPLIIIATLMILTVPFSADILSILGHINGNIDLNSLYQRLDILTIIRQVAWCFSFFFIFVILIYWLKKRLLTGKVNTTSKTWDCGFQRGTEKMQYTGSSYSDNFYSLFTPIFKKTNAAFRIKKLFPLKERVSILYDDKLEKSIGYYIWVFFRKPLNFLSGIQSGNTQNYLLYGLLFLLIMLVYVLISG